MSSTQTAPSGTITIRVLYNDVLANRRTDTEEALVDDTGTPYRMSHLATDTRVQVLVDGGAALMACTRILSDTTYQPGDPLLEVHTEDYPAPDLPSQRWAHQQCERIYALLNIDHPDGWAHRSMSMGDVIVIGETAWVCEAVGFEPVDITGSPIETAAQ